MFDYNRCVKIRDIRDGTSKTMAVGEGAGGPHWPICLDPGCVEPEAPEPIALFSRQPYYARQFWIGSGNTQGILEAFHWTVAGHFGCTLERLNKRPVTHFLFDENSDLQDCRGTLSNPANTHRIPNFRSDHTDGANFLFVDGSVRFIEEAVDLETYRAMSTISGDEPGRL